MPVAKKSAEKNVLFAVGGGSVIDACKIISAQAKLPLGSDIWDYEYVERKIPTEFIPMGLLSLQAEQELKTTTVQLLLTKSAN